MNGAERHHPGAGAPAPDEGFTTARAMDVLVQLAAHLDDADRPAILGLRHAGGTVDLVESPLTGGAEAAVRDDVDALVVVTTAPDDVQHLLCVLRTGEEVGLRRVAGEDRMQAWSTDDTEAARLRPDDEVSAAARAAFDLPGPGPG
jgi:hypothetical protein